MGVHHYVTLTPSLFTFSAVWPTMSKRWLTSIELGHSALIQNAKTSDRHPDTAGGIP